MNRMAGWTIAGVAVAAAVVYAGARGTASAGQAAPAGQTTQPAASKPAGQVKPTGSAGAKADRAALEEQFAESLRNVVFTGSWQMSGDDKKLGAPRTDRYSIESAHKADGDWWVIKARIQYEDHDVTLPVRVRVVWAEDAPVITLDELNLPGLGVYSARVMVFRGYYAGTWFAPGHGGVMSGQIVAAGEGEKGTR